MVTFAFQQPGKQEGCTETRAWKPGTASWFWLCKGAQKVLLSRAPPHLLPGADLQCVLH